MKWFPLTRILAYVNVSEEIHIAFFADSHSVGGLKVKREHKRRLYQKIWDQFQTYHSSLSKLGGVVESKLNLLIIKAGGAQQ